MARLLVYAAATPPHPEERRAPAKYRRGDVIKIVEDHIRMGAEEENGALFRVVEIPGMNALDRRIVALVSRDPGNTEQGFKTDLGWTTHKRQMHVDLDTIEAIAQSKLGRSLATGEKIVMHTSAEIEKRIERKLDVPRSTVWR